jgi:hypothetical protein
MAGVNEVPPAVPGFSLTFRDAHGKAYTARSDAEGVYELRHLPPGPYVLDSQVAPGQYVVGSGSVINGVCSESPVNLGRYSVFGRLIPGLSQHAEVRLIGARENASYSKLGWIASDGWFYFYDVPPGEYYLLARMYLAGQPGKWAEIYHPGTERKDKAMVIRVSAQPADKPLDFARGAFPLVPIPVIAALAGGGEPVKVEIRLLSANVIAYSSSTLTELPSSVFGVRGVSYEVLAVRYGPDGVPDLISSPVLVSATADMKPVRLLLDKPL